MIALSTALTAAFNAAENQPIDLYELQLDSGTYYFSDQDITWNGHHYLPYVISRSDIKRYMSQQFDSVTVTFSNVDTVLAQLIAANDVEGGILTIRKIDRTVTDDSLPLFIGQIQRPGAVDEKICELTALEYLGSIDADAPARLFDVTCPWPFAGAECGYSGSATDCDHSWSNCSLLSNTDRFGGFRFMPATGTYQYTEVTQSRFLLFFTRKKKSTVTVAFNSLDDTPYDVPIPIVLGRAQVQGIAIEHEDAGVNEFALIAFCVGRNYFFTYVLANNTSVDNTASGSRHYGELGGTGSQVADTFLPSYPYSLLAYMGIRIPSSVGSTDPAPSVTAVVGGLYVDIFDFTGAFAENSYTDNAVWNTRGFMALPLAQGGMGIPAGFFDDAHNFAEGVYTDEYIADATNCQKIYLPDPLPSGMTVGDNYRAYRSTCVEGQDPTVDGPYFTFTPGVDDDTSRTPDVVNVKRFTVNCAIAEQGSATDILYQKLLPAFRGYLKLSKTGKIQICCERANPNTTVSTTSAAGATEILCSDPTQFASGDLLTASTYTVNAEVLKVDHTLSDRIVLVAAAAKPHLIGDELLKVSMYFNDANIVTSTPIQFPCCDRQSSTNRVTVKYPDAPAGFEPRQLYVNDYANQAKVRKVNNEDLDGSAIDSYFQAWRIGEWKRAMYRDLGKFITFRADMKASPLEIADVIAVDAAEHGLQAVPFRVVEIGFTENDEVDVVGQIYSSAVYNDDAPQVTLTVPSMFGAATPPTPICTIASAGDGSVTFSPITFVALANTSTINSAVIVLLYRDAGAAATAHVATALSGSAVAGAAATLVTDTDLTGIVKKGDWLLIGGEMMFVTADAASASVAVERALGLTTSEAQAIGAPIYRLLTAVFTYTFPPLFFSSSNAAGWGPTEALSDALIALLNIEVFSNGGVSLQGPVNYSQATGGLIATGSASLGGMDLHAEALTPLGGVVTPNPVAAQYHVLSVTAAVTVGAPTSSAGGLFYLEIVQGSTAYTVTFDASVYESPIYLGQACAAPNSITDITLRLLPSGKYRATNVHSYIPA